MPWQDQMNVEVSIESEHEPTQAHVATLRSDAWRLTDDASSIRVEHEPKGDRYVLVTSFTMRFQAQYKCVGDIAHRFKMGFGCDPGYVDMTIRFPKDQPSRPRRRRT